MWKKKKSEAPVNEPAIFEETVEESWERFSATFGPAEEAILIRGEEVFEAMRSVEATLAENYSVQFETFGNWLSIKTKIDGKYDLVAVNLDQVEGVYLTRGCPAEKNAGHFSARFWIHMSEKESGDYRWKYSTAGETPLKPSFYSPNVRPITQKQKRMKSNIIGHIGSFSHSETYTIKGLPKVGEMSELCFRGTNTSLDLPFSLDEKIYDALLEAIRDKVVKTVRSEGQTFTRLA